MLPKQTKQQAGNMAYVGLSRRALLDIAEIENSSIEKWGSKVASEYLQSIEDALNLLRENPQLLRNKDAVSDSLTFYRVRQHFLVCSMIEDAIFVLTVKHGAMDLPARMAELEPHLAEEASMLHRAYQKKRSKS